MSVPTRCRFRKPPPSQSVTSREGQMNGLSIARTHAGASPGNGPAKVIEILQSDLALLCIHGADEVRNAFIDAQARVRAAHVGTNPSRSHQQHRAGIAEVASRE